MSARALRVVSWNVNGLRACGRKGFESWIGATDADVVGLQEVRALPSDLPPSLLAPRGWHDSPIRGGDGNREFFLHAVKATNAVK